MSDEYLWNRSGEGDEFVRELEHRLAPLDEADALVASLELDLPSEHEQLDELGPADRRDGAEVVYLHPLAGPSASSEGDARTRGWLWLAAAVSLLAVSVGMLARANHHRGGAEVIEVAGSGEASGRVAIAASTPAALAALRPAHPALARCVAEHPPAAPVELTLELAPGEAEASLGATSTADDQLADCLRAAVESGLATEDLDQIDAVRFTLEIQ